MKKTCISLCLIVFAVLQAYAASSWKETRTVVFTPAGSEKTHLLQPDQSISETVTFGQSEIPTRKFLRVIGGVKMPAPFQNRGEEMFRRSEFYIDDNLDSVIRKKDRYSLYFKGEDDNFERHAYYRISGKLLKPGELTVTLPVVKKQGLTVSGNGVSESEHRIVLPETGNGRLTISMTSRIPCFTCRSRKVRENIRRCLRHSHCGKMWLVLSCVSAGRFQRRMLGGSSALIQNKKAVCSIPIHQVCPKTGTTTTTGR